MDRPAAAPSVPRPIPAFRFALLAVLVGIVAGLGAAAFRALIALFHNGLFLGRLSTAYDANAHTPPSPWGPLVIAVPVVGALGVAFLVKNFALEAKGHGVPEVIDAVYYRQGRIRPAVAAIKALASALSIGSGGSVGREGPIVQIGASFGATLAQVLRLPSWQRIVLVAAGAGSGIAATFNTPVGGILFTLEIMMHEVSARTLVPVAIATATATYVGRLFFGSHPSFVIPALETPFFQLTAPLVLLAYVGLGVIMGLVSAGFIKVLYATEDLFEQRVGGGYYRQHLLGMLVVGLLMYGTLAVSGHYYIEGVGYATVQDILTDAPLPLILLLALAGLKLLATSITLGSGASGGIFSPGLFIGATLGACYGAVLHAIVPGLSVSVPAFALAGMAGIVGGTTGAAIAAVVMIFEMTLDYNVIVPMTITVAISYGMRTVLSSGSIYTEKLRRRGHYTPEALHANLHFVRQASDVMEQGVCTLPASGAIETCAEPLSRQPEVSNVLVVDPETSRVIGVISRLSALGALIEGEGRRTAAAVAQAYVSVRANESLFETMVRMERAGVGVALVTRRPGPVAPADVQGVITRESLANATVDAVRLFAG